MTIQQIKMKARPALKKAGVTRSAIFGSHARGEQKRKSDVDILIDLPKEKTLFDFIGLRLDLEERLGRKVDLIEYSTVKPHLKKYIFQNAISISPI